MNIERVEGIGPHYAAKLKQAGIRTTEGLLKASADPKGRQKLAQQSGISEGKILEWANRADLMRIKGVGEEYSDLLEQAGVDTVNELRNRNPSNLYETLVETNKRKKVVRRVPPMAEVKRWVSQAKSLKPMLSY